MENESKKSRKKNRLKDFDYSSNASYFLTICSDRRKEIFSKIVYDEIATVIKQFKGVVSKEVGMSVWQKGFYDHIIRDDEDYQIKYQYIDENPIKCCAWEAARCFPSASASGTRPVFARTSARPSTPLRPRRCF